MEPLYGLSLELVRYAPLFFALSITLFMFVGWCFGRYRLGESGGSVAVRDSLVAAIFGLSALVLSFTFSSASSHYDARIETIRTLASSIKDVYGSVKYLKPDDQIAIRKSLIDLLDQRLAAYKNIEAMSDIDHASNNISALAIKINENIIEASKRASSENAPMVNQILIPQLNNLVGILGVDSLKTKSHPPILLTRFLYILLCLGALLIGYTMAVKKENDWFLAFVYVLIMGFGLHVILSLEYPNLLMPYGEFNRDLLLLKNFLSR